MHNKSNYYNYYNRDNHYNRDFDASCKIGHMA